MNIRLFFALFVLLTLVSPAAKADDNIGSVGWLRDACKIAQRYSNQEYIEGDEKPDKVFKAGYCIGILQTEKSFRTLMYPSKK